VGREVAAGVGDLPGVGELVGVGGVVEMVDGVGDGRLGADLGAQPGPVRLRAPTSRIISASDRRRLDMGPGLLGVVLVGQAPYHNRGLASRGRGALE